MHWGHAISKDLVQWQELADSLCPDETGTMFSGSGVVDDANTANFQTGAEKSLVLIYTAAGGASEWSKGKLFTQCLAYSNDGGKSWTKYQGNPIVEHLIGANRDPKVIWHEPSKHWIMALFLDKNNYALMISTDLKSWEKCCEIEIPGGSECPDFFELAVDGDTCRKWVFWVANGRYLIGSFDGIVFQPESTVLQAHQGNHFYAAQTWSNIPENDGRRIQIGWATLDLPGMPFNKFMTFPTELTLRNTEEGIRLFVNPVREIEKLHEKKLIQTAGEMGEGEKSLAATQGELLDIQIEIDIGAASCISLIIRGVEISYHPQTQQLTCLDKAANLGPMNGKIKLRILVDRTSIEIFGNSGRVYMPMGVILDKADRSLAMSVAGGQARLTSLEIYQLKSTW
jgi:sucrose-6-phosphate hydrolase SacC (GH32 family)